MQVGKHGAPPKAASGAGLSAQRNRSGAGQAASGPLPDGIGTETIILRELGLAKPLIRDMAERARAHGTSVEQELLASGAVQEDAYYEAMARLVDLPFLGEIGPERIIGQFCLDTQLQRPTMLRLSNGNGPPITVICPEAERLPQLTERLEHLPSLRDALAIASPTAIRRASWAAGADRRVRHGVRALFEDRPAQSARIVMSGGQGFHIGLFCGLLIGAVLMAPLMTALALHVVLSLFFLACTLLRLMAALHPRARPIRRDLTAVESRLPVYTVLVALYREAGVVPQLMTALNRLNWPLSLLDIKLVCEADDPETIAAIERQQPGPHIEIVRVPPMHPRTKPKALNYAMAGARGTYLAVYDAEDRPHPDQLLEAHQRFSRAGPELACLQAPLVIANGGSSWISAVFALEYAGLFRRLLPALARFHLPLPLGGTSNHFRVSVLNAVGGWDPYNVTEDADLGLRLYRQGYRTGVLSRQTLEDAPTEMKIWIGQRTRWLKGWFQTWLVVMRDPAMALRQMGPGGFVAFQLLIGGMLMSALCHPLLFVFVTSAVIAMAERPDDTVPLSQIVLLGIDIANILGSYAAFFILGATAMIGHERALIGRRWCAIPLYWLMISWAGWRALLELRFRPFFWQKTPHMPRETEGEADKPMDDASSRTGVNGAQQSRLNGKSFLNRPLRYLVELLQSR
ncbi:glycosyltransferase family 2 protein [Rhizobium sp. RU36D]|uniref:glycosyltransferase family 2 protein n=1 Tax=Rhizobium sp. RU36D TaxID=1907415 RepID=UPI0009D89C16|nr:glycosyltransferase family 2 protein [Rhizobium sp. RU36D]SMD18901.1 Glycosyltransferase, catalytic subunit of cellulose synthase and poly-beta-1,6-N-acetylglucosamine synthase [Rhizobium sp. RU36D]